MAARGKLGRGRLEYRDGHVRARTTMCETGKNSVSLLSSVLSDGRHGEPQRVYIWVHLIHSPLQRKLTQRHRLTMYVCMLSRSVMSDSIDPINCSPPGTSVHGIF